MPLTIHGCALPFDRWLDQELCDSEHGGVQQRFRPGAFAAALRREGVPPAILSVDDYGTHPAMQLASTADGSLRFWEDAIGLMFSATLRGDHRGDLTWHFVRDGVISTCCLGIAPAIPQGAYPPGSRIEIVQVPRIHGLKLLLFRDSCVLGSYVRVGSGMPANQVANWRLATAPLLGAPHHLILRRVA